jgi:small conductance mechanosensitive channel
MLENLFSNRFVVSSLIFILYLIVSNILKKTIDKLFLGIKKRVSEERMLAKTKTLRGFLKNIVDFILLFVAVLMILSQFNINITPILTGAGVLGLAISFGSQTLIKDLISGFFILIEDQFNVGDYVKIGNFEGEVYKLTMRLTVLKDKDGNLVYIPNSQIVNVVRIKKNRKNLS